MDLRLLSLLFCLLTVVAGELFSLMTLAYVAGAAGVGYLSGLFQQSPPRIEYRERSIPTWTYSPPKPPPFSPGRLKANLDDTLIGQHIAKQYIYNAVTAHAGETQPKHALSLVLAGKTGTGKNLASSLIAKSIWGTKEDCVHVIAGRQKFTEESLVDKYRNDLYMEVRDKVKDCPHSIFIFDEIDKIPPNILDVLKPFLDYHHNIGGVDFRKAIFLFLTNLGGLEINSEYHKLLRSGVNREEMKFIHFEDLLKRTLFKNGMLQNADSISSYLINAFIPFLPMEMRHVEQCIVNEFNRLGMVPDKEDLNDVLDRLEFRDNLYSVSGCKRVAHLVSVRAVTRDEDRH